ncbi:glucosaminidase domain-containing protein [Sulfurimonas sp. HSL-3221]|uniref:glucosaminidase domain-containing protein n=1 Tax=Sulfurimonadaceae TaxID=2771471 RepID=UPI001E398E0A|nr:glucosaminidase domain-containing protein [Sulfurimonas sp. HSL-3221]UFS63695.1 glucosaminidase domain-containing protein [Sulfurimonas sp. HSL-3221]
MQKFILGVAAIALAFTLYTLYDIITSSPAENEPVEAPNGTETVTANPVLYPEPTLSARERKDRFIRQILPAVQAVKAELDAEYARAKMLINKPGRTTAEEAWLQEQMQRYNVAGYPCLLRSMHTHPVSLVIAQAALETGWGSSRFFKVANNVFGIWSYNKHEPRIAASEQRGTKTIYVKKFATLNDAIRGYFKMIGKGYAYSGFRRARYQTDNPFELLRHLRRYSELRDEYVARLYYVMKANKLYTYDTPSYAPIALVDIVPEYVAQKMEEAEKKKASEQQMCALNEVKVEGEEREPVPCEEEPETNLTRPAPGLSTVSPARSFRP